MKYKVIWFDDKFAELDWVLESASLNDIVLVGFTNAHDGIIELERNILAYDAAIVDGLFYQRSDQTGDIDSTIALGEVARTLDRLRSTKTIPWFIFSGKEKITRQENELVQLFKAGKRYDKTTDLQQLWLDLKQQANRQIETQLRHNYARAFQACQQFTAAQQFESSLLIVLLLSEKAPDNSDDTKEYFNSLRKLIEYLFHELNIHGVIPDQIFNDNGWINACSRYLSGKHERFTIRDGLVPSAISFMIWQLIQILQDSSHAVSEKLNQAFDEFIGNNRTPYLFKSCVFLLLDILIWYDAFVSKLKTASNNQDYWIESVVASITNAEWIKGSITIVASNGFGTFQPQTGGGTISIPPDKMNANHLTLYQQIEITTKPGREPGKIFVDKIRVK